MKKLHLFIWGMIAGMMGVIMTGCAVPKNVAYFQDMDSETILESVNRMPIVVKPGDKLAIIVKSKDPAISALFNMPIYSSRVGQGASTNGDNAVLRAYTGSVSEGIANYTVTPQGDIDFPVLGMIKVEGMTRSEVAAYIRGELVGRQLVKDPTVAVEFLSAGVNILGEVNAPGRYDLNRDDINVLQALSLAGDLSINGERNNVKVIRTENGKVNTYVLDLTDGASLVKNPGFYLQQDDVIYVEPNAQRKRASTVNGNNALSVSFWVSVASLLTSVVTTIAVFINK
ncbi:MAG: polysaccharide biosynthesis/export family protein [Muribaculaceae bacterium]|nr:polysaccharide biosynthesis/export family protein [Muribaculaceae bacterium]